MAKHEVVIHENTSVTKEVAPFLGNYVGKETIREAGFASQLALKSGLSAIQAQAILDGSFEALEALEKESLVRIHTDVGVIAGTISGSFETADAAFDPLKNTLDLGLYLDEDLRLALADADVTIIADENLTKLRVDNVMDLAVPRPFNLIHGQQVFRVAGWNMEFADEGACVFLENKDAQTFPVVVDEIVSKQLFKGHSAALLEPGDYKLVVKSRAGEAEGPLQTAFRRVKYLKVVPPGPSVTKLYSGADTTPDGQIYGAENITIVGEGLKLGESDKVTYSGTRNGTPVSGNFTAEAAETNTDTKLVLNYMKSKGDVLCFDNGSEATFRIKETLEKKAIYRDMRG